MRLNIENIHYDSVGALLPVDSIAIISIRGFKSIPLIPYSARKVDIWHYEQWRAGPARPRPTQRGAAAAAAAAATETADGDVQTRADAQST